MGLVVELAAMATPESTEHAVISENLYAADSRGVEVNMVIGNGDIYSSQ